MWLDFWNSTVVPALITIVTAAVSVAVAYATAALKRLADKQKAEWAATIMSDVALAAETAVAAVNQTFADDIRAAVANDGKLTRAEGQEALDRAFKIVVGQLGEAGWKALVKLMGSSGAATSALLDAIEAAVGSSKKGTRVG